MRLTQFGTISLPENNGTQSIPFEGRMNVVDLQYGGVDLDGNTTIINPTIIQHNAVIISSIQSNLQALTKELGKGRLLLRANEIDNTTYQTFGKVIQFNLIPDARKYGCEQAIQVGLNQIYPYWLLSSEEPDYFDDGYLFDGSINYDSGNKTTISVTGSGTGIQSGSTTITNSGGAAIRKGYFVFTFSGSPTNYDIDWIEIRNVTNGLTFRYQNNHAGTGTTGEFTANWLSKTFLTDTSDLDHSNIVIPRKQIDWFALELGDNVIEVDYQANVQTDLSLDIYHSQHWLY